jgi:hypothetical protein
MAVCIMSLRISLRRCRPYRALCVLKSSVEICEQKGIDASLTQPTKVQNVVLACAGAGGTTLTRKLFGFIPGSNMVDAPNCSGKLSKKA